MTDEALPDVVCGCCGVRGKVVRFQRREEEEVRGFRVEVTKTLRRCASCGEEFQNSRDPDWRIDAYDAYRATKGWVTPKQIQDWREDYDLSQEDVGRLLGWGEVTLGRYERGALASDSHNSQLAHLMAEGGIARALAEHPDALSDAKKAAVRARLAVKFGLPSPAEIRAAREMSHLTPGIAGLWVFASAETWTAWENGETFPDARASRLIRLMLSDPSIIANLRGQAPSTTADISIPVLASRAPNARGKGQAGRQSSEAKAFWASAKGLGFKSAKLRDLFPDWTPDAETHRTACVELGAFAQAHVGLIAEMDGNVRLMPFPRPHLKATRHQKNRAHLAAVAMSIAIARLVAKAARPSWDASLPSASVFRANILGSTNRGWVDFANLASHLWSQGVPVIYLPGLPVTAKGMDGMVVRAEGRPVVVLCKDQPLSDWMLFTLAHEAGHIGLGHLADEEGATFVDDRIAGVTPLDAAEGDQPDGSSAAHIDDPKEVEANAYAEEILVDGGTRLVIKDRIPPAEELSEDALEFGKMHHISPGHVVLNALRHTPNPPFNLQPLAMKTLKLIDQRLGIPSTGETCRVLMATHLDMSKVQPEAARYLAKLGLWS